ncbi:hypothetical protein [Amycolatopsis kentuckyensis]|uniref:hypothetical protein n=1 Tax=Amycolatopsis kentuckyensis TaxID=218823 RepID=UPI003566C933
MPSEHSRDAARRRLRRAKRNVQQLLLTAFFTAVMVGVGLVVNSMTTGGSPSESPPAWIALSGVLAVAAGSGALTFWRAEARSRREEGEVTYRDRITEVKDHLTRTSTLLRALEDDLATRTKLLEQAEADADRYEKLASLNAEQAKAVEDLVGRQFQRQGRANAIYWWAALVIAFISGIVVNAVTPTVLSWFS